MLRRLLPQTQSAVVVGGYIYDSYQMEGRREEKRRGKLVPRGGSGQARGGEGAGGRGPCQKLVLANIRPWKLPTEATPASGPLVVSTRTSPASDPHQLYTPSSYPPARPRRPRQPSSSFSVFHLHLHCHILLYYVMFYHLRAFRRLGKTLFYPPVRFFLIKKFRTCIYIYVRQLTDDFC